MTNAEDANKDEPGKAEQLAEMELRLQKEVERYKLYNRVYIGQLSEEDTTDMETGDLTYLYLG